MEECEVESFYISTLRFSLVLECDMHTLSLRDETNNMKYMCRGSATRDVDDCYPDAYLQTRQSLSASMVPAYSLPGNNDYPLCDSPVNGLEKDHGASQPIFFVVRLREKV